MKYVKIKIIFFVIIINVVAISCSDNSTNSLLEKFSAQESISLDLYNELVIIPVEGCKSCIWDIAKDIDCTNTDKFYIFTGSTVSNTESLINYLPNCKNFYIDKDNFFIKKEVVSTMPVEIRKNGSKFVLIN
jgi:hypothetical protein